ncbi:MAG: branched-chain amino acid ABC transporter permease [Dehalococcoidia bacterium]|nr:branched-chain amino acid ABC transporter permease [Dehalococcoidia bacterium]
MELTPYFQSVVSGISIGMIYVLIALGLTLVFGIMEIVNFAHGTLYMLGAYAIWGFFAVWGVNYILALAITIAILFVAGAIIERLFYRPLRGKFLTCFIMALGLSIVFENSALIAFGPREKDIPTTFPGVLSFQGVFISGERLAMVLLSMVLVIGLFLLIQRTKLGRSMRAVQQDGDAAALQGVSRDYIFLMTMGIGSALAGAAAGLVSPLLFANPFLGEGALMKSFIIIIVGGMGSIPGAMIGGLLLGLIESFGILWLNSTQVQVVLFGLVVLMLLVRPQGFMGRA